MGATNGDAGSDAYQRLRGRIDGGAVIVGVIGLGYVGLPLAGAIHDAGLRVIGFDIDPRKIDAIGRGEAYLKHLGTDLVTRLSSSDAFTPTSDFAALAQADALLVCVPTPIGPHREPDLSYVLQTGRDIGGSLRAGQLVVLESTTYPGTTRDEFLPAILAGAGSTALRPGVDFFVAFSPEREDPGRRTHSTRTIPKLVGGLDERSTELAAGLYGRAIEHVVPVASAEVAEAAKILENTFRAVNIALVNELKVILDRLGIDVWKVVRAAATKPFGFMPFYPGPGLGGHCIPIDPYYLSWKAREVGRPTRFIELAGEINTAMPEYVTSRAALALNERGKPVKGSSVLVIGLAYKPDVDDTRESPSFELIARLQALGARVGYHDPHVPVAYPVRKYALDLSSQDLDPQTVAAQDAIVIATNHTDVDYELLARHARLIVDTRDAMRPWADDLGDRLVRA